MAHLTKFAEQGAANAAGIVRSLSRPGTGHRPATAKSVAWSDGGCDDKPQKPEKPKTEDEVALSKELEEELNRDFSKNDEDSIGCWQKFTAFLSSK